MGETKQFLNSSTEQPLENNDVISFGFNTACVYDINDKNAFIYRLVKECIETIDLMLSDDDDDQAAAAAQEKPAPPPPLPLSSSSSSSKDKIISIENKVIDIDSDSNSEYSGDEYLQNIEEMNEQSSSLSSVASSDMHDDGNSSSNNSSALDSDDDYDDEMVVTKSLFTHDTPTETISLDSSGDEEASDDDAAGTAASKPSNQNKFDSTASTSAQVANDMACKEQSKDHDDGDGEKEANGDVTSTSELASALTAAAMPSPSPPSAAPAAAEASVETPAKDTDEAKNQNVSFKTDNNETSKQHPNNATDVDRVARLDARLQDVKRRIAENNAPKNVKVNMMTKAKPIRKRRRTLTESEYMQHKKQKQLSIEDRLLRREKLAEVAARETAAKDAAKAAAEATATAAGENSNERPPFVPKVKIVTVSRGEQLCTDMLALDPTNV